ncbi:hypothetical protein MTO96_016244 [Rhipicephalus appendiculatus]
MEGQPQFSRRRPPRRRSERGAKKKKENRALGEQRIKKEAAPRKEERVAARARHAGVGAEGRKLPKCKVERRRVGPDARPSPALKQKTAEAQLLAPFAGPFLVIRKRRRRCSSTLTCMVESARVCICSLCSLNRAALERIRGCFIQRERCLVATTTGQRVLYRPGNARVLQNGWRIDWLTCVEDTSSSVFVESAATTLDNFSRQRGHPPP